MPTCTDFRRHNHFSVLVGICFVSKHALICQLHTVTPKTMKQQWFYSFQQEGGSTSTTFIFWQIWSYWFLAWDIWQPCSQCTLKFSVSHRLWNEFTNLSEMNLDNSNYMLLWLVIFNFLWLSTDMVKNIYMESCSKMESCFCRWKRTWM